MRIYITYIVLYLIIRHLQFVLLVSRQGKSVRKRSKNFAKIYKNVMEKCPLESAQLSLRNVSVTGVSLTESIRLGDKERNTCLMRC